MRSRGELLWRDPMALVCIRRAGGCLLVGNAAFWINDGNGVMGGVVSVRPDSAGSAGFSDFVAMGIVLVGIDRAVCIDDRCKLTLGIILERPNGVGVRLSLRPSGRRDRHNRRVRTSLGSGARTGCGNQLSRALGDSNFGFVIWQKKINACAQQQPYCQSSTNKQR